MPDDHNEDNIPIEAENVESEGNNGAAAEKSGEAQKSPRLGRRRLAAVVAAAALIIVAVVAQQSHKREGLPDKLYERGLEHFEAGRYKEAHESFAKLRELAPDRSDFFYQLGYSLERVGRDDEAASAYESRLRDDPADEEAQLRLASTNFRLGKFTEALEPLKSAVAKKPNDIELLTMLAETYDKLDDGENAALLYVAVIDAVEEPESLYEVSKALMERKLYQQALRGFEKMERYVKSDDRRPFHSANAAKNMLGWPTDPEQVIVPGKSVGSVRIGAASSDVRTAWGDPVARVIDGEHALWGYDGDIDSMNTLVFMQNDRVIEINTTESKYRTATGLGLTNFLESKYKDRFDRWEALDGEVKRYDIKEGGLAFFVIGDRRSTVVYDGIMPLSEATGELEWELTE